MMAPLYDNHGKVRYFIGCQVDISGLIDGGKGLESFARLLAQRQDKFTDGENHAEDNASLSALKDLASILSLDERLMLCEKASVRAGSDGGSIGGSIHSTPRAPTSTRVYVGMDDQTENDFWPSPSLGKSGRLPGVYQNVSTSTFHG